MKGATRLLMRHQARTRETSAIRSLRQQAAEGFTEDRHLGRQLPLSMAPYRLQAADRWWRENGAGVDTRKRPS